MFSDVFPCSSGKNTEVGWPLQAACFIQSCSRNTVQVLLVVFALRWGHPGVHAETWNGWVYFDGHDFFETFLYDGAFAADSAGLFVCVCSAAFVFKEQVDVCASTGCLFVPGHLVPFFFLAGFVASYRLASWHWQSHPAVCCVVQMVSARVTVPQWSQVVMLCPARLGIRCLDDFLQ